MKIMVEHYDCVYSIETGNDITIDELVRVFRSLALCMGYSIENVNEYMEE